MLAGKAWIQNSKCWLQNFPIVKLKFEEIKLYKYRNKRIHHLQVNKFNGSLRFIKHISSSGFSEDSLRD